MAERTQAARLLVLRGQSLETQGILGALSECFDVHVVEDVEAALEQMRRGGYDAVLAATGDFLPLERTMVSRQAAVVLETIGDGVGIVGPTGELLWANGRLREFPPEVIERLRSGCAEAYRQFSGSGEERGKRFSVMLSGGTYYEVICSPVRDRQGAVRQVAAVVVNVTAQRRAQLKLNAIDRAGRELVRLDDDPDKCAGRTAHQRLQMLEELIIRYSRDVLNFKHFEVLLLDERTNRLEAVVEQGLATGPRAELFALPEGNGICGYVAATGRSYVCADVRADARYLAGLPNAGSSLTVPLRLHDRIVGVLNVESDKVGAFGEEDRQFAEIFANHVAVALHILNLLVFERHRAHTQLSGSICAELSGPLNDVITEATEMMEDYIGHDDLRKRLGALIDDATAARRRIAELAQQPAGGVLGSTAPQAADPVLTGKRVLVADDEELIRSTMCDVLVGAGCLVDSASDGEQAIRLIERNKYDLVLSDIKMPRATGYDVFAAARAANPRARVILVTAFGYDPHHSIVRANREGLSAVLMKPFKVRQLLDECVAAIRKDATT